MDSLSFLDGMPLGTDILKVFTADGAIQTFSALNLDIIRLRCPLLACAFEHDAAGRATHAIELRTRTLAICFLRFLYLGEYVIHGTEDPKPEPCSLLLHVELYNLGKSYGVQQLMDAVRGNLACETAVACSWPQPDPDLCHAIRFTYENLAGEKDLIDTLLQYTVSCFEYHQLAANPGFRQLVENLAPFHNDLCRTNWNRGFLDDGASDIIAMPGKPYPIPETAKEYQAAHPGSPEVDRARNKVAFNNHPEIIDDQGGGRSGQNRRRSLDVLTADMSDEDDSRRLRRRNAIDGSFTAVPSGDTLSVPQIPYRPRPQNPFGFRSFDDGTASVNHIVAPDPTLAATALVVRQDQNGVEWMAFQYSLPGVIMEHTIRCDVESVNVEELPQAFKIENCVFPQAYYRKDHYKGNRLHYETECNTVGWALAQLNPSVRGNRGLIQRAVAHWRNTNPDPRLRSRRVRKLSKTALSPLNLECPPPKNHFGTNRTAIGEHSSVAGCCTTSAIPHHSFAPVVEQGRELVKDEATSPPSDNIRLLDMVDAVPSETVQDASSPGEMKLGNRNMGNPAPTHSTVHGTGRRLTDTTAQADMFAMERDGVTVKAEDNVDDMDAVSIYPRVANEDAMNKQNATNDVAVKTEDTVGGDQAGSRAGQRKSSEGMNTHVQHPPPTAPPKSENLGFRMPQVAPVSWQPHRTHRLQDYQVQLMLLKQQNEKRLLAARQERDMLSRGPPTHNSEDTNTDVRKPPPMAQPSGENLTFGTPQVPPEKHENQALRDALIQMQLMLLEQQNKKRICMARQEQGMLPRGPPTHNLEDTNMAVRKPPPMAQPNGENLAFGTPQVSPKKHENHGLDAAFRMQLMLLEQQNERRLLAARQEQDMRARGPPASVVKPDSSSKGKTAVKETSTVQDNTAAEVKATGEGKSKSAGMENVVVKDEPAIEDDAHIKSESSSDSEWSFQEVGDMTESPDTLPAVMLPDNNVDEWTLV